MQMAPKDAGLNASGVGAHLHRRPMQMATNGPTPGELPGLSVGTVCISALCKLLMLTVYTSFAKNASMSIRVESEWAIAD